MKDGHVLLEFNYEICKLCGATYEQILDNVAGPCRPIPCIGRYECAECTLTRDNCVMTKNGPTCAECVENIRKNGVALRSTSFS